MRFLAALLLGSVIAWCAPKGGTPAGSAANTKLRVEATLYQDAASIQKLIGQPLDEGFLVVAVKLQPLSEDAIRLDRDHFFLRSDKDGQRSSPYSPSQLAGAGTMRISSRGASNGGLASENRGPAWGGLGGGRIGRMPGQANDIGNSATIEEAAATIETGKDGEAKSPLLLSLERQVLADSKETREPLEGLLYFLMEGKHKVKQLELHYRGTAGKLDIRFLEPK
ncbi:MAG: hypothetical protein IT163_04830 [Bryobacterales bacterium]|nr:hypothetical protein [Bryobacterales bacterium]